MRVENSPRKVIRGNGETQSIPDVKIFERKKAEIQNSTKRRKKAKAKATQKQKNAKEKPREQ